MSQDLGAKVFVTSSKTEKTKENAADLDLRLDGKWEGQAAPVFDTKTVV